MATSMTLKVLRVGTLILYSLTVSTVFFLPIASRKNTIGVTVSSLCH